MDNMRNKENSGSALIVVIVSMLFIGIIAAIVLSIAHGNLESIISGKKSSESFYSAETAIDELKNAIQSKTDKAVKEAYKKWIQEYLLWSTNAERQEKFEEYVTDALVAELKEYFYVQSKDEDDNLVIVSSPTNPKGYLGLLSDDYDITSINVRNDASNKAIVDTTTSPVAIRNIALNYKNPADGDNSTITTDLVINIKEIDLSVATRTGVVTAIDEFALIADQTITNHKTENETDTTISITEATDAEIVGSIYGGGKNAKTGNYDANGIEIAGSKTDTQKTFFYSNKILSRSILNIMDSADFIIKSNEAYNKEGLSESEKANVWVKNILIDGDAPSNVELQASCYVSDDLTIDSDDSTFKMLTNSEYYGYSSSSTDSEGSSAVVVNGKNVKVDFVGKIDENGVGKNLLWLAGTSYVRVPKIWGVPNKKADYDDDVAEEDKDKKFLQGESIVYRSLQSAYLLPGECIKGIGHNPLTQEEYNSLDPDTDIDIKKSAENNGINLSDYVWVKPEEGRRGYKESTVVYTNKNGKSETMTYLYLDFKSANDAARYFKEYARLNDTDENRTLESKIRMFGEGQLLFDTTTAGGGTVLDRSKVTNVGNIIYYDYLTGEYKVYFSNVTDDESRREVAAKQRSLSSSFEKLTNTLSETGRFMGDLSAYIADLPEVNEQYERIALVDKTEEHNPIEFVADGFGSEWGRNAYLVVSDGDLELKAADGINSAYVQKRGNDASKLSLDPGVGKTGAAGMILVDGDVFVGSGTDFWGIIIATGNI
ncbi:MAG: hypothetical protein K6E62_10950, partial [Lachnospiraceae bacterium]|nr:hypothetical protein [Lachnospiraceae bacterium]